MSRKERNRVMSFGGDAAGGDAARVPPLREALRQFARLLGLIRSDWVLLAKGWVLGLFVGMLGMVAPYLSKLLIDEVYPSRNVSLMHLLVAGMVAVSAGSALIGTIRRYVSTYVIAHLENATSLLFFNHLQHLPIRFFDDHRVGEIMSRFSDVRSSLRSVSQVFGTVVVNGVYLLLVPPFLFLLQWKLAVVSLVTMPVTVLVTTMSAQPLRKHWKRSAEAYADLGALQMEVLSHIRTLKAMAIEHRLFEQARRQTQVALQTQLDATAYSQAFGLLGTVVRTLGTALFTWYGWTLVLSGQMTLGAFIAFGAYIGYLNNPLYQLVGLFSSFQQSAINLGRMFEYLDAPTEQSPMAAYRPLPTIRHTIGGDIYFRDVEFGYEPERPVLRGLNLHIPRGQITAVVGHNGVGKSALLRLITRMVEPTSGEILLDNTPATAVSLADLRRQVAVVWQEFSLVHGTIWDNLTLGAENPSPFVVSEVVRLCRLEELIGSLPDAYETRVGEWGATLSGGQRQKLALARALVQDTPVLLLDEATSQIDLETEAKILRELFTQVAHRTVVFATHRMASAALADRIAVLESGSVVAVGSHIELLERHESYRRLLGVGEQVLRDVGSPPRGAVECVTASRQRAVR